MTNKLNIHYRLFGLRCDPHLVNSLKGYMKFEQETLQKVIDARSKALGGGSIKDKTKAGTFHFEEMPLFEIPEEIKTVPKVDLNF